MKSTPSRGKLAGRLQAALQAPSPEGLEEMTQARPTNRRDRFATLLSIYDLHTGPLERVGERARWQHHPVVAALKADCEADWLAELETIPGIPVDSTDEALAAMRALAVRDRLAPIYQWLARDADWASIVDFLTLEGGPDGGFDDLVATCQIGLSGPAKMELAVNYWDEMGCGDPQGVHTFLHNELTRALDITAVPVDRQPVSALARTALGGLLATNRWLQPEMLGALGLIELQAGPRCQLVLQGLRRCGAPATAFPFYQVHADVDPRHGKDWLEKAIAPLVDAHPEWGSRILRGAQWRSRVNADFNDEVYAKAMGRVGA